MGRSTPTKHGKSSLYIIAFTGRSVTWNFYFSSSSCDLFLPVLMYMREQKTVFIRHDTSVLKSFLIISAKKVLFLFLEKKFSFLGYVMVWYREFLARWEKLHREKWIMDSFPESQYINLNPDYETSSSTQGNLMKLFHKTNRYGKYSITVSAVELWNKIQKQLKMYDLSPNKIKTVATNFYFQS